MHTMGLVISGDARQRFRQVMELNTDKNYLTPLELAALADNHLINLTVDDLEVLLAPLGFWFTNDEDREVLKEAIRLAQLAREA